MSRSATPGMGTGRPLYALPLAGQGVQSFVRAILNGNA